MLDGAGKEKESMKRKAKGKQRLVGDMAIRWIAVVHFCKFSCWRIFSSVRRIVVRSKFRGAVMRVFLRGVFRDRGAPTVTDL
jgi:hypothetical protein